MNIISLITNLVLHILYIYQFRPRYNTDIVCMRPYTFNCIFLCPAVWYLVAPYNDASQWHHVPSGHATYLTAV